MSKLKMRVHKGDITQLSVDAIVNAANNQLRPGSGVCGAIHRGAGPELAAECQKIKFCETGDVKLTKGYQLPAKFVIQAVGPIWHGGNKNEPALLASCYHRALQLASDHHLKTIAFPAISCGVYGYPIGAATQIAVKTTSDFLKTNTALNEVIFVAFDDNIYQAYQRALDNLHE